MRSLARCYAGSCTVSWSTRSCFYPQYFTAEPIRDSVVQGTTLLFLYRARKAEIEDASVHFIHPRSKETGLSKKVSCKYDISWDIYSKVKEVMVKLYEAIHRGEQVELTHVGLKANTFSKVLSTLEDLEFVIRKHQTIVMLPKGKDFVLKPEKRSEVLAEGALKIEAFAVFVDILKAENARPAYSYLAKEIKVRLGADWKDSTALVYVRIMLDWASHANLAPLPISSIQSDSDDLS